MYEDFASKLRVTMWPDYDRTPKRETDTVSITDVSTVVIDGNFPWTIVTVTADDGTVGVGEAFCTPGTHDVITEYLRPVLVGENPTDVERLYNLMHEMLSGRGAQGGIGTIAISGVEIALWDLTGKLLNQPVYQLIGGKTREEVRVYADCHAGEAMVDSAQTGQTAETYEPEAYARATRDAVEEGYELVKFDLDVPSDRDVDTLTRHFDEPEIEHKRRIVAAVDEELGEEAEFAVDLHWNFNPESAERLAKAIEPYDVTWFEDPLPPENTEAMARFKEATEVPVLTGENRYGRHGFRDLLEAGAVDFVSPDVTKAGGIAELRKIADMAEMHYVALAPHNAASPIGTVATAHVGAATPHFLVMEHHAREVEWWEDLLVRDEPLIQDGRIRVPDGPGLGVELDWDVVEERRK